MDVAAVRFQTMPSPLKPVLFAMQLPPEVPKPPDQPSTPIEDQFVVDYRPTPKKYKIGVGIAFASLLLLAFDTFKPQYRSYTMAALCLAITTVAGFAIEDIYGMFRCPPKRLLWPLGALLFPQPEAHCIRP